MKKCQLMKKIIYVIFVFVLSLTTGCSVFLRSKLPSDYTTLHYKICKGIKNNYRLDKSLCDGQLMMLHIGSLLPPDTISVYLNDKLVLDKITTDYSYPYIDKEEYGGHGEHSYDFLLYRRLNNNALIVMNLRDPKKKVLARVSVNDTLDIRVVDEKGGFKRMQIPENTNCFFEILFGKTSWVDTVRGAVRHFD